VRRWCDPSRVRELRSSSVKRTLTTASGVHLKVSYNLQKQPEKAATVILLHGWLGSSESPYIVSLSQALLSQGFNVIRLNFRDHGHTEALNPEVFHSCRLQEMIEACEYIQQQFPKQALSLIGFSLGANFVLRINADSDPSHLRLHRVISFCPVLSAENSLLALESGPELYRRYFMYRWRQILRRKEQAFPKLYAKNKLAQIQDLRSGTDYLVQHCTDFTDLKQYMDGYSVIGDRLQQLQTQCHIVLAKDDPIIPWRDHQKLATSHKLEVYISEHGGHCGFLDARLGSPWIDQYCLDVLSS
jgi:predicted alpha/beta-fold hydrolase|tara:strand:+ start:24022 stop:24924 length:903 start_codon:yes stop_codon:yes gene_type:complete